MKHLSIPVETPRTFCDIDFGKLAQHYEGPIHVITDLEGTATEWDLRADRATIAPDVISALSIASLSKYVLGAHAVTNRGGSGGQALTEKFIAALEDSEFRGTTLVEYPRSRAERKPSGTMSTRLVDKLSEDDGVWGDERSLATSGLIVAFVGDKLSDMLEADILARNRGVPVVGFMVERYGSRDHPLDTVFGKRRSASAARRALQSIANNQFLKL